MGNCQKSQAEPYIMVGIYDTGSCWAYMGRPWSGYHKLNLGWCNSMSSKGSMVHEIGHGTLPSTSLAFSMWEYVLYIFLCTHFTSMYMIHLLYIYLYACIIVCTYTHIHVSICSVWCGTCSRKLDLHCKHAYHYHTYQKVCGIIVHTSENGCFQIADWAGHVPPHFEDMRASIWAKVAPKRVQLGAKLRHVGPKFGPSWSQVGPRGWSWGLLAKVDPKWIPCCGNIRSKLDDVLPICKCITKVEPFLARGRLLNYHVLAPSVQADLYVFACVLCYF